MAWNYTACHICIKNRQDYNLIFGFVWSRRKEFFFCCFVRPGAITCRLSPVMCRLFHHCRFQVRVMELVTFANCLVICGFNTLPLCPRFLGMTRAYCLILVRLFLNKFPFYSVLFFSCIICN